MGCISFKNGDYFGKLILGQMRLFSSSTEKFLDKVFVFKGVPQRKDRMCQPADVLVTLPP